MNVAIVCCFDTWQRRVDSLYKYFTDKQENVTVILSDFKHREKKYLSKEERKPNYHYIHAPSYMSNVSLDRILSHLIFSVRVCRYIKRESFDLVYVLFPPNLLAFMLSFYRMSNDKSKLILDMIDMWPESLLNGRNFYLISKFWKYIRDYSLSKADKIICECDLYKKYLENDGFKNVDVLYMTKQDSYLADISKRRKIDNIVSFCWLGSINNIIDINKIKELFKEIIKSKQIELHVIGGGEKINELKSECEKLGCKVFLYGIIHDEKQKHEIFNKCHFALNIMKPTVSVGLTMKSIDYFEAGLPVINTINGDTWNFVEQYKTGFNLLNIKDVAYKIISIKDYQLNEIFSNCRKLWNDYFSSESTFNNLHFLGY